METLKKFFTAVDGYKSIGVGLGIGTVTVLAYFGMITREQAELLFGLLGAGGMIAIKSAIVKSGPR